jgi:hypothetical protein
MFNSVHRFQDLFQKLGRRAILLDNVLWATYRKIVVPEGPVSCDYAAASGRHRDALLKHFKECALIRAGSGFVSAPDNWYCVLCDRPVELSALSENTRSKVRRGLKNCAVRRVDATYMAGHAWPVIASAFGRYQNSQRQVSEGEFKRHMTITQEFGDIVHYWGVFENETGRLIAYAQNYLYDNVEVNYSVIKLHIDFLRLYPSYALFYQMNRYYLDEQTFSYVNDGFRGLLHETNIQEFLIRKFSFKKQPVGLKVHYRPLIGGCLSVTYPFRHLLGRLYRPLAALYKLEEINRG